jgi:molybdate transport system substrate-binding protein
MHWMKLTSAILAAPAIVLGASTARAVDIKVMIANAMAHPIADLTPAFETSTGHTIVAIRGGSEGLAKRIRDGEVIDIIVIAASDIDKLISDRKLVADGRADFAKSGIGVAVRAGLPLPEISSRDAVRTAVLAARSIAYSSGPSGYYVAELLKKMAIADEIKDRVKQPPSGVQISELLARGDADLGFQQVSELLNAKGIAYLGPLPPEIQNFTVYAAGLHAAAPQPDAAKLLVKHLTMPAAAPLLRKYGLEPG